VLWSHSGHENIFDNESTCSLEGQYDNHQCYEQGRNISRYAAAAQVGEVKEAIPCRWQHE
jgi:hypothetical protein